MVVIVIVVVVVASQFISKVDLFPSLLAILRPDRLSPTEKPVEVCPVEGALAREKQSPLYQLRSFVEELLQFTVLSICNTCAVECPICLFIACSVLLSFWKALSCST